MATADEAKEENIMKMGKALGEQYSALWQQLAHLNFRWQGYVELFGEKPSRIDLMNEAAASFFGHLESEKWESILLHLARLTDPPRSAGKFNLTVQSFPDLIQDADLRVVLTSKVQVAVQAAMFCRDWRNRRLAHIDLDYGLDRSVNPLQNGSRADVRMALEALANVMNAISIHYLDSTTSFDVGPARHGEWSLLRVLYDGVRERKERNARIGNSEFLDRDEVPDL